MEVLPDCTISLSSALRSLSSIPIPAIFASSDAACFFPKKRRGSRPMGCEGLNLTTLAPVTPAKLCSSVPSAPLPYSLWLTLSKTMSARSGCVWAILETQLFSSIDLPTPTCRPRARAGFPS